MPFAATYFEPTSQSTPHAEPPTSAHVAWHTYEGTQLAIYNIKHQIHLCSVMTSPLRFGLGEYWWVYHKDKKCYDISRDALGSCFSFNTTQGQPGTTVLAGSRLTTLVVVDMQNFFLHPQCNDYPEGLEAAERTVEVVAKCRKLGIQV